MGSRKHNKAELRKEENKAKCFASLKNVPSSPRKMRLIADMVRGMEVEKALYVLKFSNKHASKDMYKLLSSAIANWKVKNEGERLDDANLFIKEVFVDEGRTLKRIQPAPQGRAHKIRKRSNHVTMILDRKATVVKSDNN